MRNRDTSIWVKTHPIPPRDTCVWIKTRRRGAHGKAPRLEAAVGRQAGLLRNPPQATLLGVEVDAVVGPKPDTVVVSDGVRDRWDVTGEMQDLAARPRPWHVENVIPGVGSAGGDQDDRAIGGILGQHANGGAWPVEPDHPVETF